MTVLGAFGKVIGVGETDEPKQRGNKMNDETQQAFFAAKDKEHLENLTYQQLKELQQPCEDIGNKERARDLEVWIDHRLDQAREIQEAALEALNDFAGGERE